MNKIIFLTIFILYSNITIAQFHNQYETLIKSDTLSELRCEGYSYKKHKPDSLYNKNIDTLQFDRKNKTVKFITYGGNTVKKIFDDNWNIVLFITKNPNGSTEDYCHSYYNEHGEWVETRCFKGEKSNIPNLYYLKFRHKLNNNGRWISQEINFDRPGNPSIVYFKSIERKKWFGNIEETIVYKSNIDIRGIKKFYFHAKRIVKYTLIGKRKIFEKTLYSTKKHNSYVKYTYSKGELLKKTIYNNSDDIHKVYKYQDGLLVTETNFGDKTVSVRQYYYK